MAGRVLSASDKLMTAASTGNTELVIQLLANSSSSTLEPDEVMQAFSMSETFTHCPQCLNILAL